MPQWLASENPADSQKNQSDMLDEDSKTVTCLETVEALVIFLYQLLLQIFTK